MCKLFPVLLLALFAAGCAGQTPAQQVATAENSFTLAVTALTAAKANNLISDADYHTIVGVEQAVNAAFTQVETDIAAGTALDASEAWKAANAALQQLLVYKWRYIPNGSSPASSPATHSVSYRIGNGFGNGGGECFGGASPSLIAAGGGGPPSSRKRGGFLG